MSKIKKISNKIKNKINAFKNDAKNYSIKESIKIALNIVKYSDAKNAGKLLYILEKTAPQDQTKETIHFIRTDFEKKGVWYQIIKQMLDSVNSKSKEKFINNFVIEHYIKAKPIRIAFKKKYGFSPPAHLVISPTMRCNLRCIGCYAGEYSKTGDLPRKYFEKAIKQAKAIGIHFITISGGEPFVRTDLLDIFKKYNDVFFQVYTNGTFLNKEKVKKIAKLGNVMPAISIEGFEKETDYRRGKGTWKKIMRAMDNLKEAGIPFGFSATPTSKNINVITQDKFIDFMIKKGALFGWYFHYIPIGKAPDLSLMPSPQQREKLRRTVQNKWREVKPIFIGDFWNDGPSVGGCMAGGSIYLHINVYGDIEPCVFLQMSADNIKKTSLEKALQSKLFKYLRDHNQSVRAKQPTSENLLTPCCIIDNPQVLRKCVKCCKPKFSYLGGENIVKNEKTRKHLDKYSKGWHKIADKVWEKKYGHKFWIEKKRSYSK